MGFLIAYLIISVSCIAISGRTLIAYTDCAAWVKWLIYVFFIFAWFSPMFVWNIQAKSSMPIWLYIWFAKACYFLFGFAFLLVMVLLLRDFIWVVAYYLSGKNIISPYEASALKYANAYTVAAVLLLSIYAVYAADKMPRVLHYQYTDARIKKPVKILMASDLHITKMTPAEKVAEWVQLFNAQQPDLMLLPGDIGDDRTEDVKPQLKELKKLYAPLGVYYTLGNHETYFDGKSWEAAFASLGFIVLHNSGVSVDNTGLYVAGLPDMHAFSINVKQALRQAKDDEYRIMMSHLPAVSKYMQDGSVDILVSGHTHGGQIFPFNWLTKWGNAGFVFGQYDIGKLIVLVSRGVGYWGPPMRLGAPNDIMLIELKPESK